MGKVTVNRAVAAQLLRAVSRGRRLDLAFGEAAVGLSPQDRPWVQEAVYGTIRMRGRLDHLLALHLRQGLSSVPPHVLDLLRLGSYQLLFMDGVPAYAAVSQTVEQIRDLGGSGMGRMANGVLRSLEREGGGPLRFPTMDSDPEGHLTTWGSHPRWMVRRWLGRWGPEEVLRLAEWNNSPPPVFVRLFDLSPKEGVALLKTRGFDAVEIDSAIPCVRLDRGTDPALLLDTVRGMVQDPGAALVTLYADVPAGSLVGDLCAAPGGKALAMAQAGAYVLAADRSLPRLELLRGNLRRVGGRVELVAAMAQAPPFRELPFVLLDVPCTGTGTLRRHPDAKWRLRPETLKRLVGVQEEIMEAASGLIPGGGCLVYSTCTLEPEENWDQVTAFLTRHSDFVLMETGAVADSYLDDHGCLSVLPQASGFDGAFSARLVRRP